MLFRQRSHLLYTIISLISVLLLVNVALIYRNTLTLELNRKNQEQAEIARLNTLDLIRNLHLLDLGVRGYGLVENPAILSAIDTALYNKTKVLKRLGEVLTEQQFPYMDQFEMLRDSVHWYFDFVDEMKNLISAGENEKFLELLDQDRGYDIWLMYKSFSAMVDEFENNIVDEAKANFKRALKYSYLLQLAIFILTVPALVYMGYYTMRTFRVTEELARLQQERNTLLEQQNQELDRLVKEKTKDLVAQSDKINAQNEEIKAHNVMLLEQQQEISNKQLIIQEQSRQLHLKNVELVNEVANQTRDLKELNAQLLEQNSRLSEFANIISHNLRAPMARIKGLANLMEHSDDQDDREELSGRLVNSCFELDTVITDLGQIINIQNQNTLVRKQVNILDLAKKVIGFFQAEIDDLGGIVVLNIDSAHTINTIASYLESIVTNLVSNTIKYRDPSKKLRIELTSRISQDTFQIQVSDNGLGIDLENQRANIFNLYKRFHLHVEGKGLGLYLVKTQIEVLGGKVEVESAINKGTVFTLIFENVQKTPPEPATT